MPIATGRYTLDLAKLPLKASDLRVRFAAQIVNHKSKQLLIYPSSEPSYEPKFVRYAAGMMLRYDEGFAPMVLSQVVVTGQRIIGFGIEGRVGTEISNDSTVSVRVVAADWGDIERVEVEKNWLRRPIKAVIRSKREQDPPFSLHVFSVVAAIKDNGDILITSLSAFADGLTPERLQRLQQQPHTVSEDQQPSS